MWRVSVVILFPKTILHPAMMHCRNLPFAIGLIQDCIGSDAGGKSAFMIGIAFN